MRSSVHNNHGSVALFLVLLLAVMAAVPMMLQLSSASRGDTRRHMNNAGQADSVARAGLEETLFWFRRQQEVHGRDNQYTNELGTRVDFTHHDAAFMPKADDSLNPGLGIVQQFPLSSGTGLWGKFVVRRQAANNMGDPALHDPHAVHDITEKYFHTPASAGTGLCWSVESAGLVFKPRNPIQEGTEYHPADEEIIGRSRVYTEIRRLTPALYPAALVVNDGGLLTFNSGGVVSSGIQLAAAAGAAGAAYYTPPADSAAIVAQLADNASHVDLEPAHGYGTGLSVQQVFGVPLSTLKGLADLYVRGSALPSDVKAYPEYGLVVIEGDALFDAAHPMPLGGVLVVNGKMVKRETTGQSFSGILYVTGDLQMYGPGHFSGTVAAERAVNLRSNYGQLDVWQDANTLKYTNTRMGEYRMDRAVTFVKGTS